MNSKTEFDKGYEEGANDKAKLVGAVLAEAMANLQQNDVLTVSQVLLIALEIEEVVGRLKEKESEV
ncbi:hypothetical protein MY48_08420 [Listeria monocytogenes]|nr:hypothetical protein [Listeria monocytogenes]